MLSVSRETVRRPQRNPVRPAHDKPRCADPFVLVVPASKQASKQIAKASHPQANKADIQSQKLHTLWLAGRFAAGADSGKINLIYRLTLIRANQFEVRSGSKIFSRD